MKIIEQEIWVLMSKDRKYIAKGVPRSRHICKIDESNKRILTYKSKGVAEANKKGFYKEYLADEGLEPVKAKILIEVED